MRRWKAGDGVTLDGGFTFRAVPGVKAPDDLRLDAWTAHGWRPVPMSLAFVVVDFMTDNEDALTPARPHWRELGGDYFMAELWRARREGWEAAARRIIEARDRAGGMA